MKKIIILTIAFFIAISFSISVQAVSNKVVPTKKASILENLKEKIKNLTVKVHGTGTILSVNSNLLMIQSTKGKTLMVSITPNTQLRRKFWGNPTIDEFAAGDTVNVIGTWSDKEKTQIIASLVRDTSIEKKTGVFIGDIITKSTNSFTIKTIARGNQTVLVSSSIQYLQSNGNYTNYTAVQVGHRVRIRGVLDTKTNQISSVTEVKDFSLPLKPTPTPK